MDTARGLWSALHVQVEVRDERCPLKTLPWDQGSLMSLSMPQRVGSSSPPAPLQLTGSWAGHGTQAKEGTIQRDLANLASATARTQ